MFFPIADSVAVIILGIITLILGVLLSSIPWIDYFILKVSSITFLHLLVVERKEKKKRI